MHDQMVYGVMCFPCSCDDWSPDSQNLYRARNIAVAICNLSKIGDGGGGAHL